jgi:tetratricopeptide (TPR) repeat protein
MAVWKSTLSVAEKSALTGLLAGYAIHNAFVFDNLASYVLFFAMLAFAASLPRKSASAGGTASATTTASKILGGTREVSVEVVEYVIAPVAIIVLIFGVYWFTWRPIQENTRLIVALQSCGNSSPGSVPDPSLFQNALSVGAYVGYQETREQLFSCAGQVISAQQIPSPTKQAFFTLASNEIQAQITATPKDARIYTLAGSFLDQIGAFSQAEPILIDAHLLSPAKQTIDFELGNDYINEGKLTQAVDIFKQAYQSPTDNPDAQTGYATALIISGQDTQAQSIFGDDPSLFNTSGIAQAYSVAKEYPKAIAIYESLIGTSTDNVNLQLALAQTQYAAGMISAAVATLKVIEKNHPEYATQIDAAIKQAQAGK